MAHGVVEFNKCGSVHTITMKYSLSEKCLVQRFASSSEGFSKSVAWFIDDSITCRKIESQEDNNCKLLYTFPMTATFIDECRRPLN